MPMPVAQRMKIEDGVFYVFLLVAFVVLTGIVVSCFAHELDTTRIDHLRSECRLVGMADSTPKTMPAQPPTEGVLVSTSHRGTYYTFVCERAPSWAR